VFKALISPYSHTIWKPHKTVVARDLSQYDTKGLRELMRYHGGIHGMRDKNMIDAFLSVPEAIDSIRAAWWGRDGMREWAEPLGLVVGSIKMWGSVLVASDGYAAQFGSIYSIDAFIEGPALVCRSAKCALLSDIRMRYEGK
jgi:hypothetical protein